MIHHTKTGSFEYVVKNVQSTGSIKTAIIEVCGVDYRVTMGAVCGIPVWNTKCGKQFLI